MHMGRPQGVAGATSTSLRAGLAALVFTFLGLLKIVQCGSALNFNTTAELAHWPLSVNWSDVSQAMLGDAVPNSPNASVNLEWDNPSGTGYVSIRQPGYYIHNRSFAIAFSIRFAAVPDSEASQILFGDWAEKRWQFLMFVLRGRILVFNLSRNIEDDGDGPIDPTLVEFKAPAPLPLGVWTALAFTFDRSSRIAKIYMNQEVVANSTVRDDVLDLDLFDSRSQFYQLGYKAGDPGSFLNADVRDFHVFASSQPWLLAGGNSTDAQSGTGTNAPSALVPAASAMDPGPAGIAPLRRADSRKIAAAIAGGLASATFLFLVTLTVWFRWRKPAGRDDKAEDEEPAVSNVNLPREGFGPRRIGYDLLIKATNNFSDDAKLGEGGFGRVYKGTMEDGSLVAVKRMKKQQHGVKQFIAEVSTIGQVTHKNLVPLKGWCHEREELLVVLEYMSNGSLDHHLYPRGSGAAACFSWQNRFNMVTGVADALAYLHQSWRHGEPLIHRDVKPANVMLDADFNARLADFGLARVVEKNKDGKTVTYAAGTPGYLAPECYQTDKVGVESDVFSFGILALEVACGRPPSRMPALRGWVRELHKEERLLAAVDSRLGEDYVEQEALRVLKVGLICSQKDPGLRPTMSHVTQFLRGFPDMHTPRELPSEPPSEIAALFARMLTSVERSPDPMEPSAANG